jgi:predicted DNA-binding protein (UPF0278 family)
MTYTIKLSEVGGITFTNGMLDMIGEKNQANLSEIKQRVGIRFQTQRGANMIHPYEGFDMFAVRKGSSELKNSNMNISPESLIEQEITATLIQDPHVDRSNNEVIINRLENRKYRASVRYGIRGSFNSMLEYNGDLRVY